MGFRTLRRLQDEIRPDFTIDEPGSDAARVCFLHEHPADARDLLAKETQRRTRKAAKAGDEEEPDATPSSTAAARTPWRMSVADRTRGRTRMASKVGVAR